MTGDLSAARSKLATGAVASIVAARAGSATNEAARAATATRKAPVVADSAAADARYFLEDMMDNYEWNRGTETKFGLYRVHPVTKARTAREAARVYGSIARNRAVSSQLEARYAALFP